MKRAADSMTPHESPERRIQWRGSNLAEVKAWLGDDFGYGAGQLYFDQGLIARRGEREPLGGYGDIIVRTGGEVSVRADERKGERRVEHDPRRVGRYDRRKRERRGGIRGPDRRGAEQPSEDERDAASEVNRLWALIGPVLSLARAACTDDDCVCKAQIAEAGEIVARLRARLTEPAPSEPGPVVEFYDADALAAHIRSFPGKPFTVEAQDKGTLLVYEPVGEPREPLGWRQIGEAPKDGTAVLLCTATGEMAVGFWHGGSGIGPCWWVHHGGSFHGATHWMPLRSRPRVEPIPTTGFPKEPQT